MVAKPAASAPAKSAAIAPVAAAVVVVPDEPPAAEEPENAAIAGLEEDNAKDGKDDDAEQKIVAVGAVGHVIKRAFHQFYSPVAPAVQPNATADQSELHDDAASPDATPRHAVDEPSVATKSPRDERNDGDGHDLENAAIPIVQPVLNPYVALGNAKKAQIRQEWQQTHDNAAALLQLLAARYDDAKKADDVIAEALSDKGLVIKAQIPMGPSNLRLDPHEIAAQFDAFADTLVHATQLVREYQDRRLEKSGNRGPLAMAQTRHGIAREPLKYLEATGSSTIRTEATLTMHQAHIASVKKQTTHLHLERDGHVALPPSTEASESVSSSATTTSSSTSNDETTSISTTTTFSNSTSRPKKQLRDAAVMGAVEKRVNLAILQRMQTKLDFLRNPRYADSTNHSNLPKKTKNSANGNDHGSKGDGQEPTSDDEDNDESAAERERMLSSCCFTVVPTNVAFTAYDIGGVYEQVVYVRNTSHVSRRLRVLPPGTLYFSIYEVVFPDPSGLIAPGMHVQIMLRFTPDSRADYKDSMVVQYESNGDGGRTSEFTILLAANRDPPELSIPLMLRAQNTLVGTSSLTRMPCKNLGGKGRFWLLTENDWTQVEASSSSAGNGLRGDPTRQLLLRAMNERELRIGAFAISPTDFELNTGDSVVIQLQYVPSCIGEQREKFVMVCDNCLVRVFQVIGRGCQVEMSITSIQDKELDASIAQMGTLDHVVFDNLLVNAKAEQRFTVSNETPIDLHFAWRIEPAVDDDEVIDMEPPPYQIAPASGMFSRTAVLEFVVAFQPTQARVHSWKATLCVLEIPMCSMPGPHQRMLLAQAFENVDKGGSIALETVDCLAVHLDGAGQLGAFSIAPRYWNFGLSAAAIGDNSTRPMEAVLLLKNVTYIARITLQNQSPARVAFEIDLANVRQQHDQTPGNPLNLASASPCFDLCVTPMRGDLDAGNGQAVVEITFTPYCVGAFSLAVPCRIPGTSTGSGASSSAKATTAFVRWLLLEGVVASGHVEMLAPEVDFGLVLVGTSTETTLSFRNPSPVAADWRLVHLEAALSFEAFSNVSTQLMPGVAGGRNRELHRSSSKDSIVSRRSSITSTGGNDTSRSSFLGFTARDILPRATVTFHPEAGTIAPGETKTVKILCFAGAFPERLRAHFCCRLAPERTFSGEILAASAAVSARAEIQAPNVYLSPSKLHLGTTYLGVTVRRTMELINVSNLEAAFKFVEPQGVSKAYTVEFSPKQGTIRSKETVPVVLMYTPRQAGRTTVLLACTVCGLTAPLGIEISTNQKGLVLSYELLPTPADMHADLTKAMLPKSPKEIALERGMATEDCDLEPETNPLSTIPRLVFGDAIPLGKRRTLHLLIRNFSGVEAVLELDAKKFAAKVRPLPTTKHDTNSGSVSILPSSNVLPSGTQPRFALASKNEHKRSESQTGSMATNSGLYTKTSSSSSGFSMRKKSLLADTHEPLNRFQSEKGKEYMRQCSDEIEDREILSQGHGIAFQLKPDRLRIPPWEQLVATIICFNNMPGTYTDDIVSRAVGAPPVFLHAQATIVGTPLTLDRNCVGLYFPKKNQPAQMQPTFHYGQVCTRSPSITRTIRVINRGPKQARLKWKLVENGRESQLVNATLRVDFGAKVQLRITPCAKDDVVFPFVVLPEHAMIPPFATTPFQITFTPSATVDSPRVLLLADAYWYDFDHHTESGASSEASSSDNLESHLEQDTTLDLRCESPSPHHRNSKVTIAAGKAFAAVRAANSLSRRVPPGVLTHSLPSPTSPKCLRIILAADVIEPELFFDKSNDEPSGGDTLSATLENARRLSGTGQASAFLSPSSYHVRFTTWSTIAGNVSDAAHVFHRRELHLVNHLNTRLTFRLESSGPFSVFRADSIAPKHPLSSADLPSAHRRAQGETFMFVLPPQMSVRIDLRFDPSQLSTVANNNNNVAAPRALPNATSTSSSSSLLRDSQETQQKRLKMQIEGQLMIKFTNRSVQTIRLLTEIIRPLVVVSPSVYFFGHVHLSKTRSVVLRLANPTVVPAAFTIQHVPASVPVSKAQKQEFKLHHSQYVDEPRVFTFSTMKGVVTGPTTSLKSAGGALPGTNSTRDLGINHLVFDPVTLTVTFQAPMVKKRYKSRFRFAVAHGLDFEVVLEGEGHLHEHEIQDQDRPIVRTSTLKHSHQIFKKILR